MSEGSAPPGTRRPGGRTARTRTAVLEAVLSELEDVGYGALTVEGVARRSGVHVTTVYRRWRSVEGLVVDLMNTIGTREIPLPDHGSLAADLRGLARGIVNLYLNDARTRALFDTMMVAATRNPDAAVAMSRFFELRNEAAGVIVERAVERGELARETDKSEVIAAVGAPLYYRMIVARRPLDLDLADRAARAACLAAENGVFRSSSQPAAQHP
ncbi:TetR/AcrR family transcriptional regulator [Embleya sp. NPDC050154]|uniref:TetR/AcrR family transcriptional regulator n=1 Tax=unclassified Embleya TaxID=2699296 RepID=UPI0037880A37